MGENVLGIVAEIRGLQAEGVELLKDMSRSEVIELLKVVRKAHCWVLTDRGKEMMSVDILTQDGMANSSGIAIVAHAALQILGGQDDG